MFALYILLIVVFMVAMAVFLTKTTVKVMGRLGGDAIYNLHQSAEFIYNTGLVPPIWRKEGEKKLKRALRENAAPLKLRRIEQAVRRKYLRQLEKLIQYAARSSTITDEETREILVNSLSKARESWRNQSLEEMTGQ